MKKVFLSLAVVAVLTVVSCKKADAPAEETTAVDSTAVAPADTTAVAADTAAVAVDSAAAAPAATPAAAPAK
ncbi:hypothetical protein C8C85_1088 [Flavobacterium sp. 103]|uniref:hypothetical protein n=1 Tax=unclassified Flavobacterium TaxID=196869 RepID=UPI000D5DC545|nr:MULTISPECIES: hypothetical protein [unclassified Flavobacterium]PVX45302.1 hypothetical protein C8C85_1088 [Flavobacterium sp. 103]QKJ62545.1 hypothetical protein HQN62_05165 [Flavobacterium sp. M31R6]